MEEITGVTIGTHAPMRGVGHIGKVLMMVIEWDLKTGDGIGVHVHGQTKM